MNTTTPNPELTFAKVVDDFLNLLLEEAGMDGIAPEVRTQMHTDLKKRLNERFFATAISALPESKVTELRELTERGASGDDIEKFIDSNIPNAQEIFSAAMLSFRNDYLGLS